MKINDIIISVLLILIILKQLKYIKALIIPIRKRLIEIVVVLFGIIILIGIMYFYANTWIHYVIGMLCIFTFISSWIKGGISSQGFISMYRYKEIILWNEIEKVQLTNSKDVKVKLFGGFMEQTFHFETSDYQKVINILKEKLPVEAELEINNYK